MKDYFGSEFFFLLKKFPWFACIYAFFLSIMGVFTLLIYDNFGGGMPTSIGTNMFDYIIAIVAWLVTTRPIYALTMHDLLTDQMFDILSLLQKQSYEEDATKPLLQTELTLQLALYIGTTLIERDESGELTDELRKRTIRGTDNYSQNVVDIDEKFRLFRMRQKLALPHALHGLCVVLIMGFHGILLPIILFDNSTWYSLIPNFILAIYTSGCIEVAMTITDPYKYIKEPEGNMAVKYFQSTFYEIITRTITKNTTKKNKKNNAINTIFANIKQLGIHPFLVVNEEVLLPSQLNEIVVPKDFIFGSTPTYRL